MPDVTAIISDTTAAQLQAAIATLASGGDLLPYHMEAFDKLRWAITEGMEANALRERLAEIEHQNEP